MAKKVLFSVSVNGDNVEIEGHFEDESEKELFISSLTGTILNEFPKDCELVTLLLSPLASAIVNEPSGRLGNLVLSALMEADAMFGRKESASKKQPERAKGVKDAKDNIAS